MCRDSLAHRQLCFAIAIGVLLLIGALTVFLYATNERNDTFKILKSADLSDPSQQARVQRRFEELGTNCLPLLLELLDRRDAQFKKSLLRLQEELPPRFPWMQSQYQCQGLAIKGFSLLGNTATSAIPAIVLMLRDPRVKPSAWEVLYNMGNAAIPHLLSSLWSTNNLEQSAALSLLLFFPTNSEAAVTGILACAKSAVPEVRKSAAGAMCKLDSEASRVVPALIHLLADTNAEVRASSALSIGCLGGENAIPAEPYLTKLLSDANSEVRDNAAISLAFIRTFRTSRGDF